MILTSNQLDEITEMAKLNSLTISDIALIVGVSPSLFQSEIALGSTPIAMAYNKGKLLAKAEQSQKLNTLCKQGSSPAQALSIKMQKDTEYYNLLESYGRKE